MKSKNAFLLPILLILSLFVAVNDSYGQGVVKSRPGTEGANDFWIREIISHTYRYGTTTASDSLQWTKERIALIGTKYDATNDTVHKLVWAFENLTNDTLIVTVAKAPETQNGNTPLLADLAGYEPTDVTVNPGESIHYYWNFGIYAQYCHIYLKVKTQASNVSIAQGSRFRFYLVGF